MALPKLHRPPEWGVESVPQEARVLGAFDLFVLWASLGVGLLVLSAGDWLVNGYGLSMAEVLVVAVVGSVVGALMLAAAARPGARHGVPTMVSLRPVLGRRGSAVPSLLNALQLLGWAAFELLVMSLAAAQLLDHPFGGVSALVFVPLFGGVVLLLALAGPLAIVRAWLEKFAIWAVFASTAVLAVLLVASGRNLNARPVGDLLAVQPPLALALDLVIVMPVSWWPLVADYNRFAKSEKASFLGTVGGFSLANAAFFALGGALVVYAYSFALPGGYADFLGGLGLLQLGAWPLLLILVDETDNAFANVYSTAVSIQNVRPSWRQARAVVAATLIASAAAAYLLFQGQGLGGPYNTFLLLVGGVFVPLLGVVIADAFVVRRAGYRDDEFADGAPAVRWLAFAAWAPSAFLYYAIVREWIPHFPAIGATLPSFALAAALHLVFSRVTAHPGPASSTVL